MILKINGNVKPYYIQTLSMIFFPGVKFPEDEEETPDTLKATLDMTESEDEVTAEVTISQGEKSCTAHESGSDVHGIYSAVGNTDGSTSRKSSHRAH